MSDGQHDDRWRAEIVDDDSAPLPEPWFLRDLRNRNAATDATRTGPERRTMPSDEALNLYRRHDDSVPEAPASAWWRRWWPVAAGGAVLAVLLVLILFVPPRVDGASTPVEVAAEAPPTTVAAASVPAVQPAALETADEADPLPTEQPEDLPPAARTDSNPSFDCAGVASRVNKMICASGQLAALDRQLAARHAEVASELDPQDRDELERSRAEFLGHKLQCDDEDCVVRTYEDRLAELDDLDSEAQH